MQTYTDTDAERDLREALDSGNPDRIDAATAAVERLDEPTAAPTLLASALWYAEHGLRVFPLTPGTKIPLKGSRGCLDATNDEATIRTWWERTPDANVAIATGHLVDVVDVDGPEGQRSRARQWDEVFGQVDADNLGKVLTPRPGGMHVYVPATGEGNGASIAPGVDYRGLGGYVVAPPSVITEGNGTPGTYRWLGTPRLGEVT